MLTPALNPQSQHWGRAVTASVAGVDSALSNAQAIARLADSNLNISITRAVGLKEQAQTISNYLLTLAVVKSESRTNAIGV